MTKRTQYLTVSILVVLAGVFAFSWIDQPRRTTEKFVGNLYHERYEDAARMLVPPSALAVDTGGDLTFVDKNGRSSSVPVVQLPFKASGGVSGPEHDFSMTALGPSTNGILEFPAVTLYLSVVGDEVVIEAMEN
jgi:hypothetical protein